MAEDQKILKDIYDHFHKVLKKTGCGVFLDGNQNHKNPKLIVSILKLSKKSEDLSKTRIDFQLCLMSDYLGYLELSKMIVDVGNAIKAIKSKEYSLFFKMDDWAFTKQDEIKIAKTTLGVIAFNKEDE